MILQSCSLVFTKRNWKHVHIKMCTQMSMAALFIIAKTWKKAKCPSGGECINKLCYIQVMEYYSALKRNNPSSHEKMWRNLKSVLLRERSQSEKATYCMMPTIWHSGKGKTMETAKRSSKKTAGVSGEGGMSRHSTEDGENTLYDTLMVDTCHYTFAKTHRTYNTKSEL